MKRFAIGVGVDGDGCDIKLAARTDDAHRNLAPVCDEDLLKQRMDPIRAPRSARVPTRNGDDRAAATVPEWRYRIAERRRPRKERRLARPLWQPLRRRWESQRNVAVAARRTRDAFGPQ